MPRPGLDSTQMIYNVLIVLDASHRAGCVWGSLLPFGPQATLRESAPRAWLRGLLAPRFTSPARWAFYYFTLDCLIFNDLWSNQFDGTKHLISQFLMSLAS